MGIKSGFNKFLRDTCPEVFEEIHISEYGFKRVAIDISLYLHKFKAICGDNWLSSFVNLVACLRRNEIHCVFIFDGKSPKEKENERTKRRDNRKKMEHHLYDLEEAFEEYIKTGVIAKCLSDLYARRRLPKRLLGVSSNNVDMDWVENNIKQKRNQLYQIFPEDFEYAKELFQILQVPFYIAPWEAEKMCSKLCIDGKVDAVLSEDTDVIAYAAPVFMTKIDTSKDTCIRIRHNDVLKSLELTKNQLLDFCILCGTDYNSNIPRVGSKNAYKRVVQHGGIDQIASETYLDTSVLNHKRVRELFTKFEDYGISSIQYCGRPNFLLLEEFLHKHHIKLSIEKIRKDFINAVIVFVDSEEVPESVESVESEEVPESVEYVESEKKQDE